MNAKTLAVEWVYPRPTWALVAGSCLLEVVYWRCGRCDHDTEAPPPRGSARRARYLRTGHRQRCQGCGSEPEVILHGLGKTGWTPRLPAWAKTWATPASGVIFYFRAADVRIDR